MSHLAAIAAMGVRDVTPTPTPTWADITGSVGTGYTANANVTISGFNRTITIRINFTAGFADSSLDYRIDSGTYTNIGDEGTFSISPGQTLNFRARSVAAPEVSAFQVINQTDSNAVLDSITTTFT